LLTTLLLLAADLMDAWRAAVDRTRDMFIFDCFDWRSESRRTQRRWLRRMNDDEYATEADATFCCAYVANDSSTWFNTLDVNFSIHKSLLDRSALSWALPPNVLSVRQLSTHR
jgi:hypothetical protein